MNYQKNTHFYHLFSVFLILLIGLLPPTFKAKNKVLSISNTQGALLLTVLENYSLSSLQNSEEAAFHLCDISHRFIQDPNHRNRIQEYLDSLRSLRQDRDTRIAMEISGNKRANSYLTELHTAKMLFRLATAQFVGNLFNPNFDGENHRFFSKARISEMFPDLQMKSKGYLIDWKVIIAGAAIDFEATPVSTEKKRLRSFLLTYEKGIISLFGGYLSGERVVLDDPRISKLDLANLFLRETNRFDTSMDLIGF